MARASLRLEQDGQHVDRAAGERLLQILAGPWSVPDPESPRFERLGRSDQQQATSACQGGGGEGQRGPRFSDLELAGLVWRKRLQRPDELGRLSLLLRKEVDPGGRVQPDAQEED